MINLKNIYVLQSDMNGLPDRQFSTSSWTEPFRHRASDTTEGMV